MKKLPFDKFFIRPKEYTWHPETAKEWLDMGFFQQMNDIWAIASSIIEFHKANDKDNIIILLEKLSNLCNIIYNDPETDEGKKWEICYAEWELYDFCLWDNSMNNNYNSVMRWFDQWCYDINYSMI